MVYQRTMGPFSVQLDYGAGEQAGSMGRGTALGGGVKYQQGALVLGVAYDQRRSDDGANTLRNYSVGGSYAVGKATAYLGHMGRRESAGDARFAISFVGLGYQVRRPSTSRAPTTATSSPATSPPSSRTPPVRLGGGNADSIALVGDYAFSKRTSVYVEADIVRARGGAVGRETEYWAGTPATDVDDATRIGVMVGMRHHF